MYWSFCLRSDRELKNKKTLKVQSRANPLDFAGGALVGIVFARQKSDRLKGIRTLACQSLFEAGSSKRDKYNGRGGVVQSYHVTNKAPG